MKRIGIVAVLLWAAAFGFTACESRTPTSPGGTNAGSAGTTSGTASGGVHDDSSYDSDEIRARLTASPTTIQAGQYSTLTWTTDEADHVYLNGIEVSENGSKNVYPTATKTYTLVAVDGDHRASSSVTVTVSGGTSDGDDDDVRARITASPTTIVAGQYSTLTWDTHDADDVYLNGARVSEDGSKNVYPSTTTTYTLVAVDGDHRATSSVTVTVSGTAPAPVPTATLAVSPTAIQIGQSCTLTWTTTNATSVTLNGNGVAVNDTQTLSPTATTTYTLVATNAAGSTTKTVTVTVSAVPPPVPMPTASLTATPASITSGQSSTLAWVTTDAASVTLNGATVSASGSRVVSPTQTATYTLVATNATGSVTKTATVTVSAPVPQPTVSLTATPATITSGQTSTLSWMTTDAATVTLNGAQVPGTGMQVVSPTTTTTYTLVASNVSGTVSRSATVTVTAPVVRLTYVTDIKPIMDSNCVMCHSGPFPTKNYDVSTYTGVMKNVTAYDPNSRLIQMTQPGAPMHGYLNPDPAGRAETIRRWIVEFGAPEK